MKHRLACFLAVTTVVLFIGTECVIGQFSKVAINGIKIKRVGCFKENPKKRNIPTSLFSDIKGVRSKTKVDYKNFGSYTQGFLKRCATAAAAKSNLFFASHNIGECYTGKVSTTYAASGASTDCKNGAGTKCTGTKQDCVGGGATSNYVYKLERLPTTPTTKPTTKPAATKPGASTKPTTKAPAAKLNDLNCQNYLVAIKKSASGSAGKPKVPTPAGASTKPTVSGKSTGPTVVTPTTGATPSPQASIEEKVKGIYKGYSCLVCLKTVNSSSSTVFLMLQFTCQGQHLKKLVAGLGASNIIKAECYPPACANAGSMYPCPSPCGMSSCSMSPSPYPSVCTGTYPPPVPYPAPIPPPQCPMSCPSHCAPACSPFCCRSLIGYKNKTGESAKKSSTFNADDFDDDDADDDDDDDNDDDDAEDNDDNDFDETN